MVWSAYFIAKLYFLVLGIIDWYWLANLALLLFVIFPLKIPTLNRVRHILAVPFAILLVYYEGRFPPISRLFTEWQYIQQFSFAYWLELLPRFFAWQHILALLVLFACTILANRFLRISTWTIIAVLLIPALMLLKAPNAVSILSKSSAQSLNVQNLPDVLNQALSQFWQEQRNSVVHFEAPTKNNEPFDIVLLQVCSLSWSDLNMTQQQKHPLFARFDLIFKQFNAVVSYSTPAAIRLLRASCGQTTHEQLYKPADPQCYLLANLQQLGYEPEILLNHDGHFNDFAKAVLENTSLAGETPQAKLMRFDGTPIAQYSFDGSAILDDQSLLQNWLASRQQASQKPAVLYYNTISLHDGNRLKNSAENSYQTYPARIKTMLDQLNNFFDQLEKSGRKVVVVLIPEHGAAYRSDQSEFTGLREIPTPTVTHVPVAVKLFGWPHQKSAVQVIDQPSSYLTLAQLLANLVHDGGQKPLTAYTNDLPEVSSVAENSGQLVMSYQQKYYLRDNPNEWKALNE